MSPVRGQLGTFITREQRWLNVSEQDASRWPNLFIVGPHKTGTTTWWEVLDQHPEVFMPVIKEPHWLDQDHRYTTRPVESEEAYLDLYADAGDTVRLGDASPWYFYSPAATEAIRKKVENPRVLIMLRDPVKRLHSLHSNRVRGLREPIEVFEDALAAEPERKQGRNLPERLVPERACYYRDNLAYTPHVQRYLDTFDDHELKILHFETYVQDLPATYRSLCDWMGVDPTFEVTFKRANPNAEARSRAVTRFLRDPPAAVKATTQLFPFDWRVRARRRLKQLNRDPVEREPLDPGTRSELIEHCIDDIEALEDLLGWELSAWKRIEPEGDSA